MNLQRSHPVLAELGHPGVIDEASQRGVRAHRVSQDSGVMTVTDTEIVEMQLLLAAEGDEVPS